MKNNRLWFAGTAIVTVAVIGLGLVLGILPKLAEVGIAQLDTATVVADNQARQLEVAKFKAQYAKLAEIQAALDDLQVAMPDTPEFSDVIRQVNRLTAQAGVMFYAITTSKAVSAVTSISAPSAPVANAPEKTTGSAPAALTPGEQGGITGAFNAIPMTVTVRGSYQQVTDFVGLLEHSDRIFLVLHIAYKVPEGGGYEAAVSGAMFTLSDVAGYPDKIADKDFGTPTPEPTATPTPGPTSTPTPTPTGSPTPKP